jgi:hypothetical protein
MAQTAVEFLKEQYDKCPESFLTDDDFNKAKEIEKEHIKEAYLKGDSNGCGCYDYSTDSDAEKYYKEVFKK